MEQHWGGSLAYNLVSQLCSLDEGGVKILSGSGTEFTERGEEKGIRGKKMLVQKKLSARDRPWDENALKKELPKSNLGG